MNSQSRDLIPAGTAGADDGSTESKFERMDRGDDSDPRFCDSRYKFQLNENGVWASGYDKNGTYRRSWLCSWLEILSQTRDQDGKNWGLLLQVRDPDGRFHDWIMPKALLMQPAAYRKKLCELGLVFSTDKTLQGLVGTYLHRNTPDKMTWCVSRAGWHFDQASFILPDVQFNRVPRDIRLGCELDGDHPFRTRGALGDWQERVGARCAGNSRLAFALSAAFAGPLLQIVHEENGGIHFFGTSSTGKSTVLKIAGSACGGRVGQSAKRGYSEQWRTTSTALETTALGYSDGLMILDEIGQVAPDEAGEISYMLANGSGRARGVGAKRVTWRLLCLSSGEVSFSDYLLSGRKAAKAGQLTRLADVPADAGQDMGVFENLHGAASPKDFAESLERAAAETYGTPLRKYLAELVKQDHAELLMQINRFRDEFRGKHIATGLSGQILRVCNRFSLIAAAGELAIAMGVLPWEPGESLRSASKCFKDWMDHRGGTGDGEVAAAISQVRSFIEQYGESRFPLLDDVKLGNPGDCPNRAGVRRASDSGGTVWMVFPDVWREEVCKGLSAESVAQALVQSGHLKPDSAGKRTRPERIPGLGFKNDKVRVYCVQPSILADPAEDDEETA